MLGNEIRANIKLFRKTQNEVSQELSARLRWKVTPQEFSEILDGKRGDGTKTQMVLAECERMIEEWKGSVSS